MRVKILDVKNDDGLATMVGYQPLSDLSSEMV